MADVNPQAQEWEAATNPEQLHAIMHDYSSVDNRLILLIAAALCRQMWQELNPTVRKLVKTMELFADNELPINKTRFISDSNNASDTNMSDTMARSIIDQARFAVLGGRDRSEILFALPNSVSRISPELQTRIYRNILGNPCAPQTVNKEWRTSTVLTLANQMYETKDFSAMPILADALQDAGCDNEVILNLCRDPNTQHVRGSWLVDMILGKRDIARGGELHDEGPPTKWRERIPSPSDGLDAEPRLPKDPLTRKR